MWMDHATCQLIVFCSTQSCKRYKTPIKPDRKMFCVFGYYYVYKFVRLHSSPDWFTPTVVAIHVTHIPNRLAQQRQLQCVTISKISISLGTPDIAKISQAAISSSHTMSLSETHAYGHQKVLHFTLKVATTFSMLIRQLELFWLVSTETLTCFCRLWSEIW